jgi:D-mannonate dehydratase
MEDPGDRRWDIKEYTRRSKKVHARYKRSKRYTKRSEEMQGNPTWETGRSYKEIWESYRKIREDISLFDIMFFRPT